MFLSSKNLVRVASALRAATAADTGYGYGGDDGGAPAEFSEQLLSQMMLYATQYAHAHPGDLARVNQIFVSEHANGAVWERQHAAHYARWLAEGIPDQNNMPRPGKPDAREERSADTAAYALGHPWGRPIPRF
jgi:hypothetical protein